jgi:hypothetical protein
MHRRNGQRENDLSSQISDETLHVQTSHYKGMLLSKISLTQESKKGKNSGEKSVTSTHNLL